MDKTSLVGIVAKQLGVSSQTIHWYEAQGLISPPERTESGYRIYPPESVEQLRFVRKALAIGFSIEEIKTIIDARHQGTKPCDMVLLLLQKKVDDVKAQIETLTEVQTDLKRLQKKWLETLASEESAAALICPLIEATDDQI